MVVFRKPTRDIPYRRRHQGAHALSVHNSERALRIIAGLTSIMLICPMNSRVVFGTLALSMLSYAVFLRFTNREEILPVNPLNRNRDISSFRDIFRLL